MLVLRQTFRGMVSLRLGLMLLSVLLHQMIAIHLDFELARRS
jgi:hypothetical protein